MEIKTLLNVEGRKIQTFLVRFRARSTVTAAGWDKIIKISACFLCQQILFRPKRAFKFLHTHKTLQLRPRERYPVVPVP